MWQWLKDKYEYVHGSFHGSEVILWSRLQVLIASLWVGLQGVDVSPVIHDPKYMLYYVIFSNVVNEWLRRRKAEYNNDGSIK